MNENRIFNHVLDAIVSLAAEYIKHPIPGVIDPQIQDNPKFFPYIDKCLGALDGVHIPSHVSVSNNPVSY